MVKKLMVKIPEDLHAKLKIYCAKKGIPMSEAIRSYIAGLGKEGSFDSEFEDVTVEEISNNAGVSNDELTEIYQALNGRLRALEGKNAKPSRLINMGEKLEPDFETIVKRRFISVSELIKTFMGVIVEQKGWNLCEDDEKGFVALREFHIIDEEGYDFEDDIAEKFEITSKLIDSLISAVESECGVSRDETEKQLLEDLKAFEVTDEDFEGDVRVKFGMVVKLLKDIMDVLEKSRDIEFVKSRKDVKRLRLLMSIAKKPKESEAILEFA